MQGFECLRGVTDTRPPMFRGQAQPKSNCGERSVSPGFIVEWIRVFWFQLVCDGTLNRVPWYTYWDALVGSPLPDSKLNELTRNLKGIQSTGIEAQSDPSTWRARVGLDSCWQNSLQIPCKINWFWIRQGGSPREHPSKCIKGTGLKLGACFTDI